MKACDVMTPEPQVVTPDASIGRAARLMRDLGVGAIPVVFDYEGRRPIGLITDRDIAVRHVAMNHGRSCAVWEHMTATSLNTIAAEAGIGEVRRRLRAAPQGRLLVVNGDRRLLGIVTRSDLLRGRTPPRNRHLVGAG